MLALNLSAAACMLTACVCTGTKAALEEQLRLGQELRARVDKPGSDDEAGSDEASSTDASDDDAEDASGAAQNRHDNRTRAAALDILQGEHSLHFTSWADCNRGRGLDI